MAAIKTHRTGASLETKNMGVCALVVGAIQAFLSEYTTGEITMLDYAHREKTYTLCLKDGPANIRLLPLRF
jgi:hypothetical protein